MTTLYIEFIGVTVKVMQLDDITYIDIAINMLYKYRHSYKCTQTHIS